MTLSLVLLALPTLARAAADARPVSSCIACHAKLEDAAGAPVSAWASDVHAAAGLGCESCHGGNPAPALSEDTDAAMRASDGFRKAPGRLEVPLFCARCHSDGDFMKRYNPQVRIDQLAEYRTSVHGRKNASGDPVPATCIDCHGAHGVRPVASPDSPVYATNVPGTCSRCHSDAALMRPYGIPTDQPAAYRRSEHAAALLERGDTSAPACNDCHGNHGAVPPGVRSVANVCGQCHGREAALFGASIKKELFDRLEVAECVVCHGNHAILHPTPEHIRSGSAPRISRGSIESAGPFVARIGTLAPGEVADAAWQVVLRPHVEADDARLAHDVEISAEGVERLVVDATVRPGGAPPEPRRAPWDAAGGASVSLAIEPVSGVPLEAGDALRLRLEIQAGSGRPLQGVRVRDIPGGGVEPLEGSFCMKCHTAGDRCDKDTGTMHVALATLDQDLRRAAGRLRTAELAGMEVGAAKFGLKSQGTTAAVEARALVHAFDPERLIRRNDEGRKVAAVALEAAENALLELRYRRKGLAVSLALIAMVLLALYLKIRQVDRGRAALRPTRVD